MQLDAIKARLGAIGPVQMEKLGKGARRLLEEDLPELINKIKMADEVVESLRTLLGPENIGKTVDLSTVWKMDRYTKMSAVSMIANIDAMIDCVKSLKSYDEFCQ